MIIYQYICQSLSIYLPISASVYLFEYLSISVSIFVSVSAFLSVYLSNLSLYQSVSRPYLFAYLTIYQSISLFICISDDLSVYISQNKPQFIRNLPFNLACSSRELQRYVAWWGILFQSQTSSNFIYLLQCIR